MKYSILLILLLAFPIFGQTDSPYTQPTIGKQSNKPSEKNYIDRQFIISKTPIKDWVGKRFLFIPQKKMFQKYGYHLTKITYDKKNKIVKDPQTIPYSELAGKIATITSMFDEFGSKAVELKVQDSSLTFQAHIFEDQLTEFIYLDDIDESRKRFLGKTLWLNKIWIDTYDEETGKTGYIKNKRFTPAKVINIVGSYESNQPVRFILELPNGEQGFADVAVSQTNISETLASNYTFSEYFYEQDPHTLYSFSADIWAAIEDRKVLIGMTKEQASLAWGYPASVKNTETQAGISTFWHYLNGRSILFSNDLVSVITER